jgi:hypothetical protein
VLRREHGAVSLSELTQPWSLFSKFLPPAPRRSMPINLPFPLRKDLVVIDFMEMNFEPLTSDMPLHTSSASKAFATSYTNANVV